MAERPRLVLFRDDLRVADNPALAAALDAGGPILSVHVHDETSRAMRPLGGAGRWWLHHSLMALARELGKRGGRLDIVAGATADCIPALAGKISPAGVHWNRRYGAAEIAADEAMRLRLENLGIAGSTHKANLLHEPDELRTGAGTPYRVFGPFWRAARAWGEPAPPLPAPESIETCAWPRGGPKRASLDDLGLLPKPDWAGGLRESWTPGETGAAEALASFLDSGLTGYAKGRDRFDRAHASRLSPHLRFGEISPRQVHHSVAAARANGDVSDVDAEKFLAELGWREFCYHLLGQFPELAREPFNARYGVFPWRSDSERAFEAWCRGRTGFPLVDAAMRQLWRTGTMHNRARMIAASFLVKDLLIDWRRGENWFWDTLCDADPANNPANWQWVAGSGADAAPFFRIFNPVSQGERFDPDGRYVRQWIPELADLPAEWIHRPFAAPSAVLEKAGVRPGRDYPHPIVDRAEARSRALTALAGLPKRP